MNEKATHAMHNDSPDTISIEETEWQHTEVDDVFLPSVRVQLTWKDLESAVERGAVVPKQAHALWAGWASPTSGLRVVASGVVPARAPVQAPDRHVDQATPDAPSPLQKYGWVVGGLVGVALGAAGAQLLGG